MKLRLYNTASREVEEFVPVHAPVVGMYSCGMTVYYYAHVGHIRAYTNSDTLRRTLEYMGYQVRHVMNVTDVGHMTSDADEGEDKLEAGAKREGKSPWEIARYYEEHFFKTIARANIEPPHVVCRATEHIADQIALIRRLEERGFAYRTPVGVIFDTAKFPRYADFARLNLEGQEAGARVEVDSERRNPADFALWVTNQPNHLMQWDSPWGRGFPGWHIECSAMSMRYLGEELDVHTGGIDHIPVHHTNEIAQSEAATGKPFVRYWMHTAFLNVDNQKMSKSLGNLYTLDDIVGQGYHPLALRYFYLGSSYRRAVNFTWEALGAAQTSLSRLWQKMADLPAPSKGGETPPLRAFEEAVGNDLNTPQALAVLWQAVDDRSADPAQVAATLLQMDRILGLDLAHAAERLAELRSIQIGSKETEEKALALAQERVALRKAKEYARADALREQILALGFIVEDTPQGPRVKPKGPQGMALR
jgi:cysteinyl-tRNA synthetase